MTANGCEHSEQTCAYAAQALSAVEVAAAEAHIATCLSCQRESERLHALMDNFVSWPCDVLRPQASLQERLAFRISGQTGKPPPRQEWSEPPWEQVAPGIECKFLARDVEKQRISMLVRLAPGASYPPHTHAAAEELHLLDGELWINERKLLPGDYNFGAPAARDDRVWSETGCTCLLVTSTLDAVG